MKDSPVAIAWIDAFRSLGYNTSADPYSGKSVGAYSNLASVDPRTKARSYSATAYGAIATGRSGVHIITGVLAQQVLLEGSAPNVTATGVKAILDGRQVTVKATKEVIISAGVFNTPKLLELSGIGNKDILEKFNIPVVIDNPNVGENLQDHLMTGISFEVTDDVMTGDPLLRQEPGASSNPSRYANVCRTQGRSHDNRWDPVECLHAGSCVHRRRGSENAGGVYSIVT